MSNKAAGNNRYRDSSKAFPVSSWGTPSWLECGICHHSKGAGGKKVAYFDAQKIEKSETCHNSKADMPDKINTYKNAAHALCKDCHTQNKPELAKCGVCRKK